MSFSTVCFCPSEHRHVSRGFFSYALWRVLAAFHDGDRAGGRVGHCKLTAGREAPACRADGGAREAPP